MSIGIEPVNSLGKHQGSMDASRHLNEATVEGDGPAKKKLDALSGVVFFFGSRHHKSAPPACARSVPKMYVVVEKRALL
jgi:hypothetical protein